MPEPQDTAPGLHRVRIIPPARAQDAHCATAYSVEIDGRPIYPSALTIDLNSDGMPLVHLTLPAIVENAEILAVLDDERAPDARPAPPVPDEIRRLSLEPGERLIVRFAEISPEQAAEYRDWLREYFPANEILVLLGDEILIDHPAQAPC